MHHFAIIFSTYVTVNFVFFNKFVLYGTLQNIALKFNMKTISFFQKKHYNIRESSVNFRF